MQTEAQHCQVTPYVVNVFVVGGALYDNGVTFHTCTDMHDIYHKFDDVNMWILEKSF